MLNESETLIEPPLYQKTLERLDLQSICLDRTEAFCDREYFSESDLALQLQMDADENQDADYYSICCHYLLEGRRSNTICLSIKATYRLVFHSPKPVPAGFFDVFRELNLRMLTLPYFRELVTSLTGRMELPTLIIPLNIFAAGSDEEKAAEETDKPARKRAQKRRIGKEGA